MPRDNNGNYVLPAGNPVVGGTTITAEWGNLTLQDVAVALQDSLSRTGSGGMLVPFKLPDGTAGAPAFTFNTSPTTGMFRKTNGDLAFSRGGVEVASLSADELTVGTTDVLEAIGGKLSDDDYGTASVGGTAKYEWDGSVLNIVTV